VRRSPLSKNPYWAVGFEKEVHQRLLGDENRKGRRLKLPPFMER